MVHDEEGFLKTFFTLERKKMAMASHINYLCIYKILSFLSRKTQIVTEEIT